MGGNCGSLNSGGNTQTSDCVGVATINQGQDNTLTVQLISQTTRFPIDISSATEITASFLQAAGTTLEKKLSTSGIAIVNGPGGAFSISLPVADSNTLQPASGDGFATFIVTLLLGGKTSVINFFNALQIVPPPFTP